MALQPRIQGQPQQGPGMVPQQPQIGGQPQGGLGGQQYTQEQLQQLAQALAQQDPKALEIFKQLPPDVQKMVYQMVQQIIAQQQGQQQEQPQQPGQENVPQTSPGGPQPQLKKGGVFSKPLKKGALHKTLGIPEDEKIPTSKLQPKPSDSALTKKRKRLAITMKKWHH